MDHYDVSCSNPPRKAIDTRSVGEYHPVSLKADQWDVPRTWVHGVGRPSYKSLYPFSGASLDATKVGYQFPWASPSAAPLPYEAPPCRPCQSVHRDNQATEMQAKAGVLRSSLDGAEDLEHIACSPPVLCHKPYAVWESYQPWYVGREQVPGPMPRSVDPGPMIQSCIAPVAQMRDSMPTSHQHDRIRRIPSSYSTPHSWIPSQDNQAKPNKEVEEDRDASFKVWRNTDANLEVGPVSASNVKNFQASGWQQQSDAEGKTCYLNTHTGRITYYLSEAAEGADMIRCCVQDSKA